MNKVDYGEKHPGKGNSTNLRSVREGRVGGDSVRDAIEV